MATVRDEQGNEITNTNARVELKTAGGNIEACVGDAGDYPSVDLRVNGITVGFLEYVSTPESSNHGCFQLYIYPPADAEGHPETPATLEQIWDGSQEEATCALRFKTGGFSIDT